MSRTWGRSLLAALVGLAAVAWPATALAAQPSVKVTIQSPAAGATVYGTVVVSGTATSKFPISTVSVSVDAGAYQAAGSSSGTWTYSLNTGALSNGGHTLHAKAVDTHGNTGLTSESVTVNNAPPTVSISSPAGGASVTGTITVTGTAASQAGVASVVVRLDNSSPGVTASGTTSWSASIDTTQYGDGGHTITATATDTLGQATTTGVNVTFDNPLITTYQSPWYVTPNPGWVSSVNETMTWDGDQNQSSRLPTGSIVFSVNDTTAPNDSNSGDTCTQNASTGYWSCSHLIGTLDLQWAPNAGGWSVHYAFNFGTAYPAGDTFTISYSGDGFFAASSAPAQNT